MKEELRYHNHENYDWVCTLELSKYTTMENLIEILDEYYRVIENIHALYTKEFTYIEESYQSYKTILNKDIASIVSGKKTSDDLLETQEDIYNILTHFTTIYQEIDTKLKWWGKFFNDEEDRVDYEQKNEKFLDLFVKIYNNIEDILYQYYHLTEKK